MMKNDDEESQSGVTGDKQTNSREQRTSKNRILKLTRVISAPLAAQNTIPITMTYFQISLATTRLQAFLNKQHPEHLCNHTPTGLKTNNTQNALATTQQLV